jgi:hypothetical protein
LRDSEPSGVNIETMRLEVRIERQTVRLGIQ